MSELTEDLWEVVVGIAAGGPAIAVILAIGYKILGGLRDG
jgi:adenine/guanine phosphoribosyltransferase-like PRPP-binding protein